jgi:hypothetical protein
MSNDKNREIVSLNRELISFDADDLNIEYLEQRLELAMTEPCTCIGRCERRFV